MGSSRPLCPFADACHPAGHDRSAGTPAQARNALVDALPDAGDDTEPHAAASLRLLSCV